MKHVLFILCLLLGVNIATAQDSDLTEEEKELVRKFQADSIKGQTGAVKLESAHCTINVPDGFIFLDESSARHLLVDYWDNPEERTYGVSGALVRADAGIFYNVENAYVVSYDNCGYVSDKDASEIDFNELLEQMQEQTKEENKANPNGPQWTLLGWGWQPSYDNVRKVLSWSKHLKIDGDHEVINYDARVLGKDGFVIITAVGSPEAKDALMADSGEIVNSISYDKGYRYADFNEKTDHVAEWTIGGLIAGKVLAKAGAGVALGKFAKIIVLAIIGFFAAMWKKIARWLGLRKDDDEEEENSEYAEAE